MVDDAQYEFTSVQAIRGTEARTIAKWEKDGWELDRRDQGMVRTELTFRRVRPATFGDRLRAAFDRLEPTVKRRLMAAAGAVVVLAVTVGVVVGMQGGGGTPDPTASATEATETPSETSAEDQAPTATSSASLPPAPAAEEVLTVENNADLAALVAITDPAAPAVAEFAATYRGRTIEFDGNILSMMNHGTYSTRYDLLIGTGDYNETASSGPNFKFEDVNIVNDLHLTGSNVPDAVGVGDNLRIVARVGDYNDTQQLLFLKPVSTEVR